MFAHPAAAKGRPDSVRTESCARREGHQRVSVRIIPARTGNGVLAGGTIRRLNRSGSRAGVGSDTSASVSEALGIRMEECRAQATAHSPVEPSADSPHNPPVACRRQELTQSRALAGCREGNQIGHECGRLSTTTTRLFQADHRAAVRRTTRQRRREPPARDSDLDGTDARSHTEPLRS
jgi:hypothetical protein